MSTRATIHFQSNGKTEAIVYRHSDGYPEGVHGVPAGLKTFFKTVKAHTKDTRFDDACYLAAKFVVWQAEQNEGHYAGPQGKESGGRLDFLGVGICMEDPGDIEYRYKVACDTGNIPTIEYEKA